MRDLGLSAGLAEVSSHSSPCKVLLGTLYEFAVGILKAQRILTAHLSSPIRLLLQVASVSNRFANVPLRQEQAKQRGCAAALSPAPSRACSTCSAQRQPCAQPRSASRHLNTYARCPGSLLTWRCAVQAQDRLHGDPPWRGHDHRHVPPPARHHDPAARPPRHDGVLTVSRRCWGCCCC